MAYNKDIGGFTSQHVGTRGRGLATWTSLIKIVRGRWMDGCTVRHSRFSFPRIVIDKAIFSKINIRGTREQSERGEITEPNKIKISEVYPWLPAPTQATDLRPTGGVLSPLVLIRRILRQLPFSDEQFSILIRFRPRLL